MVLIRELRDTDSVRLGFFFWKLSNETIELQNRFGKVNAFNWAYVTGKIQTSKSPKEEVGYIALEDDVIVAYGWLILGSKPLQKYTCNLGLVVRDGFQGQGIGKQLCEYMISEAHKLKIRKIWLLCYTSNTRAYNLYLKLGFQVEGIFQNQEWDESDKPLSLYSMARFL